MKAFLKILVYLVVAVALGAALAPAFFWAGRALAEHGSVTFLGEHPFHRYLSRCVQVSVLVLLWPALRWTGLRRWSELGLRPNPNAGMDVVSGFVLGALGVFTLGAFYLLAGLYEMRLDPHLGKLPAIALTAGVVSVVEETVFRGVVLGLCLWSMRDRLAVALTTLLFTAVHFIKPAKSTIAPSDVTWWSGFEELGRSVGSGGDAWLTVFAAASLMVAGWILARATLDTRSLWLPIGLHAGWILGQQSLNVLMRLTADPPTAWMPWVGPSQVSGVVPVGLIPLASLLLTGWLVWAYLEYVFRRVDEPDY